MLKAVEKNNGFIRKMSVIIFMRNSFIPYPGPKAKLSEMCLTTHILVADQKSTNFSRFKRQ